MEADVVAHLARARQQAGEALAAGRPDRAYVAYADVLRAIRPPGRILPRQPAYAEIFAELGEILLAGDYHGPALQRFETSLWLHADPAVSQRAALARAGLSPPEPPPQGRPEVSIVMLTHNCWTTTRLALQQLWKHTPEMRELIVVDNASTDQTRSELERLQASQPRLRLIFNRENRGFAAGCNQGAAISSGAQILFLNNDVLVTPGWLARLQAPLLAGRAQLVGPSASGVRNRQQAPIEDDFTTETDLREAYASRHARTFAGQGGPSHRLLGFCLLVGREVLDRIGGFDPRFGIGNYEDDDFGYRAQLAGFRLWHEPASFVHHIGQVSFKAARIDFAGLMAENRRRFAEKWGLGPDFDADWPMERPLESILARSWSAAYFVPLS